MKASALLDILSVKGVKLEVRGNILKWDAPDGGVKSYLRKQITIHERTLVRLIRGEEDCSNDQGKACNGTKVNDETAKNSTTLTTNTLHQGHALDVLKGIPDGSIDCGITSPPYWQLRDYGTPPQIWGGDQECEHEFTDQSCSKCGAWRGELGQEPTPDLYVSHLCDVFDETKRTLKPSGTFWVVIGDTYNSHYAESRNVGGFEGRQMKNNHAYSKSRIIGKKGLALPDKCLVGIPSRFQLEMVERGWILRNIIIWHKPNCLPSSAKDRFTVDFEYIFFFAKSKTYSFQQQKEPCSDSHLSDKRPWGVVRQRLYPNSKYNKHNYGSDQFKNSPTYNGKLQGAEDHEKPERNKRCVWSIPTARFPGAHFAVFPEQLVEEIIEPGCPEGGIVLDPFAGSGTTCVVAAKHGRKWIGIELNPEYFDMAKDRLRKEIMSINNNMLNRATKSITDNTEIEEKAKNLKIIYEPKGEAREYAPLAASLYKGCAHGCAYCYGPKTVRKSREAFRADVHLRKGALKKFKADVGELKGDDREVLLSFTTDPYQPLEMELGITREAIKALIENDLRFTILTKGGTRAVMDFDLLEGYDKASFGSTIVFTSQDHADKWEPNAPSIRDRIIAVEKAHARGIRTWVSLEPVIDPGQALELIRQLHQIVDHWKVGKLNHHPAIEKKIDWIRFREEVIALLDSLGADYYLKKSLTVM